MLSSLYATFLIFAINLGLVVVPTVIAAPAPIKFGIGVALKGQQRNPGTTTLLALKIWAKNINAKGGLLGRPVKLIYYDNESDANTVADIYEKLIKEDKVDFILGGFGTVQIAQAIPVAIKYKMVIPTIYAGDANKDYDYPYYFDAVPAGPNYSDALPEDFFQAAARQNPRPNTVVLLGNNNELGQRIIRGAAKSANHMGFQIIDTKFYPSDTKEFEPILADIKSQHPDIVFVSSYPADSKAIIKAMKKIGLRTKMFGGGMAGLQFTSTQTELGPQLNGIVVNTFGTPSFYKDHLPQTISFLKQYQEAAKQEKGADILGTYVAPYAYASIELLEIAIKATGSLDQTKIGEYLKNNELDLITGKVRFAPNGECDRNRILWIQFQGIKGNEANEFANPRKMVIVQPEIFTDGKMIYPL